MCAKKNSMPQKKSEKSPSTPMPMSMEEAFATLIKRNEELLSLNKSKDEFIAITSHQLRTPATGVKQYLGLLLEGYAEPLTKTQKMFLGKAYENNERQLHIVDEILRVAQLDLDKLVLHPFKIDMRKVVEAAASALEGKVKERSQTLTLMLPKEPIYAKVDAEHFRMAIENLLENASNYSADCKKISVSLKMLKNSHLRITVADEGIGIKEADVNKLFQKFSRLDNSLSHNVTGTGLGLYFSKKVVQLHGGTIRVHSKVDKGTKFIITIPPATSFSTKNSRRAALQK